VGLERMDVELKESPIHEMGVYALRGFRAGDVVLRWDTSNRVPAERAADDRRSQNQYLHPYDSKSYFVVQSPECYVNHSCDHNTNVVDFADVAIRDIAVGEEITSNYETDGAGLTFICKCGRPNCRGVIGSFVK
jgi:SET domain-containing protein